MPPSANTRYWCRTCAAYDASPCGNVSHISEMMRLVSGEWMRYLPARLVIAHPPPSGRGAIEWSPCDEQGRRTPP